MLDDLRFFGGRHGVEQMQFLAWLKADGFAGGDRYFGSGSRVAANAGLSGPYVEDAKTAKLDSFAIRQGLLKALKNRVDRRLGLHPR